MTGLLFSVLFVAVSLSATYASYFPKTCYQPENVLEKFMVEGEALGDSHDSGYGHEPVCSGQKFVLKSFKINVTDYYGNRQLESCVPSPYGPKTTYIKCTVDNCKHNYGYGYSNNIIRCVPTIQSIYLRALCTPVDPSATTTASTETTTSDSTATTTDSTASTTDDDASSTATSQSTISTPTMMPGRRKRFAGPGYLRSLFHEPFFNDHGFHSFGGFDSHYRQPKQKTPKPRTTTMPPTTTPRTQFRSVTIKLPTFCNCKFFDC